jgi:Bacterial Ig domain
MRLRRAFHLLLLVVFLAGCGGGGGSVDSGSAPVADTPASPNYAQLASTANLAVAVNLAANTVQVSWTDTFPSGAVYSIQSVASGTGTTISTQAASGTGNTLSFQQNIATSTTYQVVATVGSQTFNLQTAQGQSSVAAIVPTAAPNITISPNTSSLTGIVTMSLDNNFNYPSVSWFLDTTQIGTGTGAGNPLQWASTGATNGQHLILAVINLTSSSTITVRKQVNVVNSNLVVNASNSGTTGTIQINVTASSNYPITSVQGTLDGTSLGVLTAPNACSSFCSGANNLYQFSFNAATVGSGNHTFVATASDSAGSTRTTTLTIAVSNPPGLNLTSPLDGTFINSSGNLSISGTASTDKAGGVTVTAFLGSLPITITQPTSTTFAGTFSLAGLPAGPYTLTVNSRDSSGVTTTAQAAIIVTSSSSTTYVPNFSIGSNGQLIAIDNSNPALVLYKANDGTYRVRNTTNSTETTLQGANNIPFLYNWAMDGGYVFVEGGWLGLTSAGYTDCPSDCIYQWTPAGAKSNISNASPNRGSYEQYPRAHGGYVIWIDWNGPNLGTYTMYNVATGAYTTINQPAGSNYMGNTSYDFAVVNGVVNFFYWAQTGGSGTTSTFDVYQWTSSTNSSTMLSSGGARSIYPQTDGIRAAWSQAPTTSTIGGLGSLVSRSVSGGVNTTLSTSMSNFKVAGGLIAWVEGTSSTNSQGIQTTTITGLKASSANGVTNSISSAPTAVLYGVGNGVVVYGASNKTYTWSAANGQSSNLLIDTTLGQVLISGSTMYFTQGSSQAVYKLQIQ